MSKHNRKRKNVPRIIKDLWDTGVPLEEVRTNPIVTANGLDVDYHWDTLKELDQIESEQENFQ